MTPLGVTFIFLSVLLLNWLVWWTKRHPAFAIKTRAIPHICALVLFSLLLILGIIFCFLK